MKNKYENDYIAYFNCSKSCIDSGLDAIKKKFGENEATEIKKIVSGGVMSIFEYPATELLKYFFLEVAKASHKNSRKKKKI